jgi:hypothetical protein
MTSVDSGFCLSPEFVQHHDETKSGKNECFEILVLMHNAY